MNLGRHVAGLAADLSPADIAPMAGVAGLIHQIGLLLQAKVMPEELDAAYAFALENEMHLVGRTTPTVRRGTPRSGRSPAVGLGATHRTRPRGRRESPCAGDRRRPTRPQRRCPHRCAHRTRCVRTRPRRTASPPRGLGGRGIGDPGRVMTTKPRVLCVDDEEHLLDGLRVSLRKRFDITTATSGADGIAAFDSALQGNHTFAAVVSDMRMPNMNGAQFLTSIGERSPDTPRILLSGQADLESTIAAINDAKIFRFLTKPCTPDLLGDTLDEAMELTRLREAERRLLDETLRGVVGMLTEVLGLVSPTAYSRSMRIGQIVRGLSESLGFAVAWDLDVAALLSQVGCVVIPDTEDDMGADHRHVGLAADLLANIPPLGGGGGGGRSPNGRTSGVEPHRPE